MSDTMDGAAMMKAESENTKHIHWPKRVAFGLLAGIGMRENEFKTAVNRALGAKEKDLPEVPSVLLILDTCRAGGCDWT